MIVEEIGQHAAGADGERKAEQRIPRYADNQFNERPLHHQLDQDMLAQMRHSRRRLPDRLRIAQVEPYAADIGLVTKRGRQRFDDDRKAQIVRRSRRLGDPSDAKCGNSEAEARQRSLGLSLVEHQR